MPKGGQAHNTELNQSHQPEKCGDSVDWYLGVPVRSNGEVSGTHKLCGAKKTKNEYGYEWQCVEFVRRFFGRDGLNIGSEDWPNIGHAKDYLANAHLIGFNDYDNDGPEPPAVNDILVFDYEDFGHVGIVTEVTDTHVHIIEQNWWKVRGDQGKSLTRHQIPISFVGGRYQVGEGPNLVRRKNNGQLSDFRIIGWSRHPETKEVTIDFFASDFVPNIPGPEGPLPTLSKRNFTPPQETVTGTIKFILDPSNIYIPDRFPFDPPVRPVQDVQLRIDGYRYDAEDDEVIYINVLLPNEDDPDESLFVFGIRSFDPDEDFESGSDDFSISVFARGDNVPFGEEFSFGELTFNSSSDPRGSWKSTRLSVNVEIREIRGARSNRILVEKTLQHTEYLIYPKASGASEDKRPPL